MDEFLDTWAPILAVVCAVVVGIGIGRGYSNEAFLHDCLNKRELVIEVADTKFVFKCEKVSP